MKMLLITLLASTAFAGLELGTYQGQLQDTGEACSAEFKTLVYLNDYKSPINERIGVYVYGVDFEVRHPMQYDFATNEISFDRGLEGLYQFNDQGYFALRVEMIHSDTYHGPGSYMFRDPNGGVRVCENLALL